MYILNLDKIAQQAIFESQTSFSELCLSVFTTIKMAQLAGLFSYLAQDRSKLGSMCLLRIVTPVNYQFLRVPIGKS